MFSRKALDTTQKAINRGVYSEPSQTSKLELRAKIVNCREQYKLRKTTIRVHNQDSLLFTTKNFVSLFDYAYVNLNFPGLNILGIF